MRFRHSLAIAAVLSAALAAGASAQQQKKPATQKKATTHATTHAATAKTVAAMKPAATTKAAAPVKAAPAAKAHAAPVAAVNRIPAMSESKPGLLKQAKVTPDNARAAALKDVAGRITRQRIEERGGKLVYAFWIRPDKAARSRTVLVDANTGAVVKGKMQ